MTTDHAVTVVVVDLSCREKRQTRRFVLRQMSSSDGRNYSPKTFASSPCGPLASR